MPVVSETTSEDVDAAGFALAPGRGPLPSVLPSVVTAPSTGGYRVLGGHLLQIKRKLGFYIFLFLSTDRCAHSPACPVELPVVNVSLPLEQI